jgi:hypothetical protein
MQISSCGFFDTRKSANGITQEIYHNMDKSLFVDTLSIDDNRNIKKLYSIMDLARQRQSIDSLINNLEKAYQKLSEYHTESKSDGHHQKWIYKNIKKEPMQ